MWVVNGKRNTTGTATLFNTYTNSYSAKKSGKNTLMPPELKPVQTREEAFILQGECYNVDVRGTVVPACYLATNTAELGTL